MSARELFCALGVTLPGSATTGSVSVPCFVNASAHKHDDRDPSCSVNLDTGQWICFVCGAKGGAFDAAVARGRSPSDAVELAKRHDLFATDREPSQTVQPRRARGTPGTSHLLSDDRLAAWRAALLDREPLVARLTALRGWTREAIDALGLGIDGERVTFPIRGADGQLVGLLRYAPNPTARTGRKMLAAKDTPRQLFPPPETLPADATVYVVEGEPDAVAMRSLGLAAVAVPGAQAGERSGRHGSPAATWFWSPTSTPQAAS